MRSRYFISTRPRADGSHTVHRDGCPFISGEERQLFLGNYDTLQGALDEGKKYYKVTGICVFCLKDQCRIKGLIRNGSSLSASVLYSNGGNDNVPENMLIFCSN